MRGLSATELERMRSTQGESMGDTCKIGTLSETISGGHTSESYAYGSDLACGLDMDPRGESSDGAQAAITDAVLRLPVGTGITAQSRVRITARNGAALSPTEDYSVTGEPDRGPTCLRVSLARVQGNRRG